MDFFLVFFVYFYILKIHEGETIESEIKKRKKYRKSVESNYREVFLDYYINHIRQVM